MRQRPPTKSEFIIAAYDNTLSAELIEAYVNNGGNINEEDEDGCNALYRASKAGSIDAVRLLLAQPGIDVNKKSQPTPGINLYATPIIHTTHIQLLELLLKHPNIDINAVTSSVRPAQSNVSKLIIAAQFNYTDIAAALLQHPEINVNIATGTGRTALHWAAAENNIKIVEWLLDHPLIDTTKMSNNGDTAESLARFKGHYEIASLIQKRKCSKQLSKKQIATLENIMNKAILSNNFALVKQCISKHPYLINSAVDNSDKTILMTAVHNQVNIELINYLINNGAKLNLHDINGRSVLDYARLGKNKDIYNLIVQRVKEHHPLLLLTCDIEQLKQEELNKESEQKTELGSEKISIINALLNILAIYKKNPCDKAEELDLYCTANHIYKIIKSETITSPEDLHHQFKQFFALREDCLKGDSHDYCHNKTLANDLCVKVARALGYEQSTVYNILLNNALTQERKEPWHNVYTGETQLPENPASFLRTADNQIYFYSDLVSFAIGRLKDGYFKLKDIWQGTEITSSMNEQPSLNDKQLSILSQRSHALKELVEYTRFLDNHTPEHSVYNQFSKLREGLYNGDYQHNGNNHEQAGTPAYIAVANFAEWWLNLSNKPGGRSIQENIRNLKDEYRMLGDVLDIILDDKNTQDRNTALYCVYLKAEMLNNFLLSKAIRDQLLQIDHDINTKKTNEELDTWETRINLELEKSNPNIRTDQSLFESLLHIPDLVQIKTKNINLLDYSFLHVIHTAVLNNKSAAQHSLFQLALDQNNPQLASDLVSKYYLNASQHCLLNPTTKNHWSFLLTYFNLINLNEIEPDFMENILYQAIAQSELDIITFLLEQLKINISYDHLAHAINCKAIDSFYLLITNPAYQKFASEFLFKAIENNHYALTEKLLPLSHGTFSDKESIKHAFDKSSIHLLDLVLRTYKDITNDDALLEAASAGKWEHVYTYLKRRIPDKACMQKILNIIVQNDNGNALKNIFAQDEKLDNEETLFDAIKFKKINVLNSYLAHREISGHTLSRIAELAFSNAEVLSFIIKHDKDTSKLEIWRHIQSKEQLDFLQNHLQNKDTRTPDRIIQMFVESAIKKHFLEQAAQLLKYYRSRYEKIKFINMIINTQNDPLIIIEFTKQLFIVEKSSPCIISQTRRSSVLIGYQWNKINTSLEWHNIIIAAKEKILHLIEALPSDKAKNFLCNGNELQAVSRFLNQPTTRYESFFSKTNYGSKLLILKNRLLKKHHLESANSANFHTKERRFRDHI